MTDATHSGPPPAAGAPPSTSLDAQLLRTALVVILGSIMSVLDTTIINVAIKELSRSFQASLVTTQWVSTGYTLALATTIPLAGWAADRFGTKRLYITSILLFLAGSALSGMAWSAQSLILFRVVQGLGGGMIMPAGMTILSHEAGPHRMGRVMGLVGVPMLLGPIIGPILGGWLVDDASWRWIFFVNIPIGLTAVLAAMFVLERDETKHHHTLDVLGLLLLSPGLALFVFGLAQMAATGSFSSLAGMGSLVGGLALVLGFILHARRSAGALIDVRLFTRRAVGTAALTTFLFGAAFFGVALLLPLYFQMVRGQSALHSGLLLAVQGLGAMVTMPISSRMTDKIGPGKIVLTGLTLFSIGVFGLSRLDSVTPFWQVELTLFFIGLGIGSTMMPAITAALVTLQRHEIARATSGLTVVQRVGGSIGTALLAVTLAQEIAHLVPVGGARPQPALVAQAFGHTFLWALLIALVALVSAGFIPRRKAELAGVAQPAPAFVE